MEALRIQRPRGLTRGQTNQSRLMGKKAICIRCGRPERSAKHDRNVEVICAKCAMYLADYCHQEGKRFIPCQELRDALRKGRLNSFVIKHRLTWKHLSEQTGISISMLRYWASGKAKPTQAERSEIISNIQGHLKPEDRGTYH